MQAASTKTEAGNRLKIIYQRLFNHYGPLHWWPAEEPFEVMVGAILTQSAAWTNVQKAIANLKSNGVMSPQQIRSIPVEALSRLVYPSGYYNAKARKLKALALYLGERYDDSLSALFAGDTYELREELLGVHGIGEETADSIILYAAGKPIFVIDAYTRRTFFRLGLCPEKETYHRLQAMFMDNLPHDPQLFNDYHALVVQHGKEVCRKRPLCSECPIKDVCDY